MQCILPIQREISEMHVQSSGPKRNHWIHVQYSYQKKSMECIYILPTQREIVEYMCIHPIQKDIGGLIVHSPCPKRYQRNTLYKFFIFKEKSGNTCTCTFILSKKTLVEFVYSLPIQKKSAEYIYILHIQSEIVEYICTFILSKKTSVEYMYILPI